MVTPYNPDFFVHFPKYHAPKKGEELIDPRHKLNSKCTTQCHGWVNEYQQCVERVRSRTDGRGNCAGQYEELGVCVDKCVAHDLFKYLK